MFNFFKKTIDAFWPENGFSILEIVVVISIIAIGLVGVSSLVIQNVQVQYFNKNTLIASQLAQEGLELVRSKRGANWLAPGNNWKTGAGPGDPSDIIQDKDYVIDYISIIDADGINDPEARLYIDSNNFYRHYLVPGSATTTQFYRLITVSNETDDSVTISCQVQWQEKNNIHDYVAETILYNWR